jgi:hypothetical protein
VIGPMLAAELQPGDVIHCPNWDEHVLRAWPDERGVAVVVAEFPEMVLHFPLAATLLAERP